MNGSLLGDVAVPVYVLGGFLGAGKTTLLNRLMARREAENLAVIVNDFGAIDVDSTLIERREEDILSLRNGCVCCSLQGDLFSTIRMLLGRTPQPEMIVIECSGVSRLSDMRTALMDSVIWRHAALEGVLCVVDAQWLVAEDERAFDPLWIEQIRAADLLTLSRLDLLAPAEVDFVQTRLRNIAPGTPVVDTPEALLAHSALSGPAGRRRFTAFASGVEGGKAEDNFASLAWESARPVDLALFQETVGRFSAQLLRAKGILYHAGASGRPLLLQMVGRRASLGPAPDRAATDPRTRLVFIGRRQGFPSRDLAEALDRCVVITQESDK
ncbi:cobalamin biosynthesis protein CobW [Acetobacter nitrogenifigens DSM 23921 = NBRC 105050]|uniref:GTPase n=1 Tax=Acetobacter nitrogenifigens DSM 23921 = NBRC 105050 TaxID=1120919 RepID=A0A511XCW1_9PROT|nr:GTP-binding protein [Acetobacter nitrogenifigens]GBQ91664.1 cobalamin biosynthesis protein CobW [Acetobacter nitrogenifigens DSM 23921 = NBRC 105050]GEN60804.1 GTPase [Acetobacter nitrogenifigens DSM 23921 = NBRC 105050]